MDQWAGTSPTLVYAYQIYQILLTSGSLAETPPTWYLSWAGISDCMYHRIDGRNNTHLNLVWTDVSDLAYHKINIRTTMHLFSGLKKAGFFLVYLPHDPWKEHHPLEIWAQLAFRIVLTAGSMEGTPSSWYLVWSGISDCTSQRINIWNTTHVKPCLSGCFRLYLPQDPWKEHYPLDIWAELTFRIVLTTGSMEGIPPNWYLVLRWRSDFTYHWITGRNTTNLISGL